MFMCCFALMKARRDIESIGKNQILFFYPPLHRYKNHLSVKKQFPVLCTGNSILPIHNRRKVIPPTTEYKYSPAIGTPFFFRL